MSNKSFDDYIEQHLGLDIHRRSERINRDYKRYIWEKIEDKLELIQSYQDIRHSGVCDELLYTNIYKVGDRYVARRMRDYNNSIDELDTPKPYWEVFPVEKTVTVYIPKK